ncbi:MAG: hypothetical protein WC325_02770 [Candidatus Bathyarchaeia archaeon]
MSETNEQKEQIKKIAILRATIEKRIEALEAELDEQKTLLSVIDSTLVQQSFKRAEIQKPVQAPTSPQPEVTQQPEVAPQRRGIPLRTVTGDVLAEIFVEKDTLQIVFPADKNFDVNLPPFTTFFVERVLAKMQEKDREDANKGQLAPENILSYTIKRDGDILKEVTIKNLRQERSRELKSSLRWTLEKMFERLKQKNQPE